MTLIALIAASYLLFHKRTQFYLSTIGFFLLRFHGPEEEHEPDSVPAHDGFAHSSAQCPCNQRMFENVPSVRGALHAWQ